MFVSMATAIGKAQDLVDSDPPAAIHEFPLHSPKFIVSCAFMAEQGIPGPFLFENTSMGKYRSDLREISGGTDSSLAYCGNAPPSF